MHLSLSLFCFTPFAHLLSTCLEPPSFTIQSQNVAARKRLAIVGGGTGGLAALKTFIHDIPQAQDEGWDIVVFEQRSDIGGVWLPDPKEAREPKLPETPLYPRLHTNTPVHVITFPGFPFPPFTPLFASHEHVRAYHVDYAEYYGLNSYIRLNHSVSSALWVGNSEKGYWDITLRMGYPIEILPGYSSHLMQDQDEEWTEHFDHLILATGHSHYPNIPEWGGNDEWLKGRAGRHIMHSIFFREPRDFANKNVLLVGGGASGGDIAPQVLEYAKNTYHSFNNETALPFLRFPNITYKPRISHLTRTSIVFDDDSELSDIDAIILATGYQNRFPLLCSSDPYASNTTRSDHEGKGVLITDPNARSRPHGPIATNLKYVFPVDRQIISLSPLHPLNALTFIGLPYPTSNAPSDILQSLFIGHLIANPESIFPGSEDVARNRLLDKLTSHENELREKGSDPYAIGQRLAGENNTAVDYQEELYSYLKLRKIVPEDGRNYVAEWRIKAWEQPFWVKSVWDEVEKRGEEKRWLEGVRTEEEWADLHDRIVAWGKSIGM